MYIEENCGNVVSVDTYISLAKRASVSDRPRSKCKVTLSSSSTDRLFIVFENADMAPKTGSHCVTERVDVYDGTSVSNTTLLSGEVLSIYLTYIQLITLSFLRVW